MKYFSGKRMIIFEDELKMFLHIVVCSLQLLAAELNRQATNKIWHDACPVSYEVDFYSLFKKK